MPNARPLIIYHKNCPDGFGGAWAAWKKFGSRADYRAKDHVVMRLETQPEERRDIYSIDYCFPEQEISRLKKKYEVTVVDHHATGAAAGRTATRFLIDMNHSGAVLSWKYFHSGKKIPYFLKTIEDLDLHRFAISTTEPLMSVLATHPYDFKTWSAFARLCENPKTRVQLTIQGKLILAYKQQKIERLLQTAEKVEFEGLATYAINTRVFHSETGNAIYERFGVHIGIIWAYDNGNLKVSLRSDGTVDVGVLAVRYGGGGHKAASGFVIPFRGKFPWKKV